MTNSREAFEAWADGFDLPGGVAEQWAYEAWQHQQARIDELLNVNKQNREWGTNWMNKADEYRKERDKLREQNAALEAHMERLSKELENMASYGAGYVGVSQSDVNAARQVLNEAPETSLARVRAEAKAEVLEDFRSEFELHCEVPDFILGCLEEYADEYRKQAEGIDQLEATVEEQNRIKHKIKGEGTTLYYDTPVTSLARIRAEILRELADDLLKAELQSNLSPGDSTPLDEVELVNMWDASQCADWIREQAEGIDS